MRAGLKVLLGTLAADLRCFSLEVFPKQDRLTGKGYGNLVKLPLGVHRVSGRRSRFVGPRGQTDEDQLAWLRTLRPTPADKLLALAEHERQAKVVTHPRLAEWAGKYPELAELAGKCTVLGQVIATARNAFGPIPAILLTADVEARAKAAECGVQAMTKPIGAAALRAGIQAAYRSADWNR